MRPGEYRVRRRGVGGVAAALSWENVIIADKIIYRSLSQVHVKQDKISNSSLSLLLSLWDNDIHKTILAPYLFDRDEKDWFWQPILKSF